MSAIETFIVDHQFWAYAILFTGMFIEGEAFFLAGALLALEGHLSWFWFLAVILIGVVLGDIVWYWLGKRSRQTKLGFFLSEKFSKVHRWLEQNFMARYHRLAFYSKFIYYVNRLTPLIAGWHGLEFKKFIRIHLGAAVFWVGTMSIFSLLLGWAVGDSGVRWLIKHLEYVVIASLVVFVIIEYSFKMIFTKKIAKEPDGADNQKRNEKELIPGPIDKKN